MRERGHMQTQLPSHPYERRFQAHLWIGKCCVVYYASAIVLLHVLRTEFDPGYRYLSEYARGPYGTLMTSTFFALSAGSLALSLGLWRSVPSKLRFLPGLLLWLIWACAVFCPASTISSPWRQLFLPINDNYP